MRGVADLASQSAFRRESGTDVRPSRRQTSRRNGRRSNFGSTFCCQLRSAEVDHINGSPAGLLWAGRGRSASAASASAAADPCALASWSGQDAGCRPCVEARMVKKDIGVPWDYVDPDSIVPVLPMPFRMIDHLIRALVEEALDKAGDVVRTPPSRAPSIQPHESCAARPRDPSAHPRAPAQVVDEYVEPAPLAETYAFSDIVDVTCTTASLDGLFVYCGTRCFPCTRCAAARSAADGARGAQHGYGARVQLSARRDGGDCRDRRARRGTSTRFGRAGSTAPPRAASPPGRRGAPEGKRVTRTAS